MYLTSYALNAAAGIKKTISDGSRTTLGKGDAVTFDHLPNQPVAIVVYNNTGNTTPFNVVYNNQVPTSYNVASVQAQGFSLGLAYLINPANTNANEITVSVPDIAQQGASVDVYAVSLFLPLSAIQNQEIPLNGTPVNFNGYSRAYATPPLAWYQQTINSNSTGSIGLYFTNDTIQVIGVNVPTQAEPAVKNVVINTANSGISSDKVTYSLNSGNAYISTFYGTSTQVVYSPVSSANTTSNGSIVIQKIS